MSHSTITITTDFGDSFASSQLRLVLSTLRFQGDVIENHSVLPYSIVEGAFQMLTLSKYSPPNTVHLGVIDPGVGSSRRGVIIQTQNFYFVGPDNGLLYPAASHDTILTAWRIQESKISTEVSRTFHGRDVFVKVAASLSHGGSPYEINAVPLDISTLEVVHFLSGQVVHIDAYGNVKIYWTQRIRSGDTLRVTHKGRSYTLPVVQTFSEVPKGLLLALLGSSGTLEVAVNLGNAAQHLHASVSDVLDIQTEELS